jgi:hypothetical protein
VTETNKVEKIRQEMDLNRRLTAFDYDKIRSDEDLSDSAKMRKLEEIYQEGQQKHKKLREAAEAERVRVSRRRQGKSSISRRFQRGRIWCQAGDLLDEPGRRY